MNPLFSRSLLLAALALAGCERFPAPSAATPALSLSPWGASAQVRAEDLRFAPDEMAEGRNLRLAASEKRGLLLLDAAGN